MSEFKECESCASKPGSPAQCWPRFVNKWIALDYRKLEAENESLKRCGNCEHIMLHNEGALICCITIYDKYVYTNTKACEKWELCK